MQLSPAYDLLVERNFLSESACRNIINETSNGAFQPATVYGRTDSGSVDERVRKTTRLSVSEETFQLLNQRLLDYKPRIEEHSHGSARHCEEPRFSRSRIRGISAPRQGRHTPSPAAGRCRPTPRSSPPARRAAL